MYTSEKFLCTLTCGHNSDDLATHFCLTILIFKIPAGSSNIDIYLNRRKMAEIGVHSTPELFDKSRQVFMFLLGSCGDHLFSYLLIEEVCKLDSALTEKSLRPLYLYQASKFYLVNSILSSVELKWIIKRGIDLTVCRLHFEHGGKSLISYI